VVVALVTTIAVLAVGFLVYRFLGDRQYATAHDAYVAGNCQEALDGFDRVTGLYQYTASGKIDQAKREAAECRVFLAATRVPDDQFSAGARQFREFQTTYPRSPLKDLAGEHLGAIYAEWGDALVEDKDYPGGVAQYATAIEEFPGTPGATAAEEATATLAASATDRADGGQACDALAILEALDDRGFLADSSRAPLPIAYYHCARSEARGRNFSMAIEHLDALIRGFGNSRLVPRAKALRIDVRVDLIKSGNTQQFSAPAPFGSASAGTVIVEIQNSSPDRAEFLFSGPQSKSVVVGRCGGCPTYQRGNEPAFCPGTGPTVRIELEPGTYEVVLNNPDDSTTRPSYGKWTLASGTLYSNCYYLVER
jgi:hypothetical protein